jgi:adenylate kinase
VPTIHIIDLARLVQRVCKDNIALPYIFAVDRSVKPTMKRLFLALSKGMGSGQADSYSYFDYLEKDVQDLAFMNLKMKTSIAFKDGEPPEDAEDPEEAAKLLKFKWHCEKGIIENIKLLNEEFNTARKLNPVKIFITGPPASGKTRYCN